ncbi:MAG: bifunctional precorrin-2 dehydrogenase/sirohydrochlorin ferrochelatase [Proteobacteria bacterium]|nr:bifunctional precorrin-2 dehydrogenase/sirohydrochlorin ferrochelatase [Desulfobulbaceae bacterium]MBU4153452.1 bifunctional precorrin-2 dehydrogenase/sirohydrochlorin ferrochelatase [Pseudomonadota bacterium]MDP2104909.1 bifunctional precorrin-2 dehydrogenase/sirohydrochlorin ferrochelatase [Desulfobulbaceae bacterium]
MKYYPVCLQVEGRRCLVVGGGKVAERKVLGLLGSGAVVIVISPELTPGLAQLGAEGSLTWMSRGYTPGDAEGFFLVMAATDDSIVQNQVRDDGLRFNILVNVADVPEKCNFILPAVVKRGALSIAISTSGKSPALAKKIRQELEVKLGPEYELVVEMMGLLRPHVLQWKLPQADNEILFNGLMEGGLLSLVVERDWPKIQVYLEEGLGRALPLGLVGELKKLVLR